MFPLPAIDHLRLATGLELNWMLNWDDVCMSMEAQAVAMARLRKVLINCRWMAAFALRTASARARSPEPLRLKKPLEVVLADALGGVVTPGSLSRFRQVGTVAQPGPLPPLTAGSHRCDCAG